MYTITKHFISRSKAVSDCVENKEVDLREENMYRYSMNTSRNGSTWYAEFIYIPLVAFFFLLSERSLNVSFAVICINDGCRLKQHYIYFKTTKWNFLSLQFSKVSFSF